MGMNKSIHPIFRDVELYIEDLFGITGVYKVKEKDALKNYLKVYEYCSVEIRNTTFVLFHCLEKELPTIKSLKKIMKSMKAGWSEDVHLVLVLSKISKYQRNVLLKEGIAFVVPYKQMYVPILGLAINEHIRESHEIDAYLSPGAQCIMYAFLECEKIAQTELNNKYDYSKSSISRFLNELSDHGLIYMNKKGVSKFWIRSNNLNETWQALKLVMSNPIKKYRWVREKKTLFPVRKNNVFDSGESYLAKFGMLISPEYKIKAVYEKNWHLIEEGYIEVYKEEENSICIEMWSHPLPMYKDEIHPIAIASTLLNENDPRIQEEIDELVNMFLKENK